LRTSWTVPALAAAAGVAVVASLAAIAPLGSAICLFGVLCWFAVPGVLLARRLYGPGCGWLAPLVAGPAWGYVLSSLALLALWWAGARSGGWLLLAPAAAAAAVWPARRLAILVSPPALTRREVAPIACLVLAAVAIVARPYSRVGADLPEGRAYRAYFTADFVWEMTIAAEVAKGDMPPQNPFYPNDALHYYWLMHLLPGAEHRAAGDGVRLDDILLINAFWVSLVFVAFLYWLVRHFVESPWAAAGGCIFVLFCSSFEGADRLWALWRGGGSLDSLRYLNIDAVGNWIYHGMKIDGLHRAMLYQPQHQLGYVLGASALLLLVEARDASKPALLFLAGVFLALSLVLSTVAAAILAAGAAAYEAHLLVRARRWSAFLTCAAAAAVPVIAVLAVIAGLHYVDTAGGGNPIVRLGVNALAMRDVAWTWFLNFGPVLIVAALGVAASIRRRSAAWMMPLAATLAAAIAFYFLIDIPEHDSVYVAWRASHIAFIALAPFCAFAFQEWSRSGGAARWASAAIVSLVALAALPTVVIDLYNTQDVWNRRMGPGFQWTVVLSRPELEALAWLRHNTLPEARVQIEPFSRERDAYYVTAFAERRMAGGLPTGLVPLAKYQAVSERIRQIYSADDPSDAFRKAAGLCVDYLVVGEPERRAHPRFQQIVDGAPHLFQPAFRNDAIAIYAVSSSGEGVACRPAR
jgi:hypothetical protein